MRYPPAVLLSLFLVCPSAVLGAVDPAIMDAVDAQLQKMQDELVEIRRDIHQHAESSGNEERTAEIVASRLSRLACPGCLTFLVRHRTLFWQIP